MVQLHAAVGIDVHQRACLIHMGQGERDAEFDRRQRQPALDPGVGGIEGPDLFPARRIPGFALQFGHEFGDDVVFHRHMIRRDVTVPLAVEVALADRQRIDAQMAGDFIHHVLDAHHPLRAAKTTERGVGNGVGLAAVRRNMDVVQVIRIVRMEHRSVGDRAGQIGRVAAADRLHELDALDTAILVETDIVVDPAMMPLAGQDHIVVAIQPMLHRPPGFLCQQRGRHRDQ